MRPLRRTHNKALGSTAITTTAAVAWSPAANKLVRVMGVSLAAIAAGADLVVNLKDGTSAAAGTMATFVLDSGGAATVLDFGDAGLMTTGTLGVGIQTQASAGTVAGFLTGREERTN